MLLLIALIVLIFALWGGYGTWGGPGYGPGASWGPLGFILILLLILWAFGVIRL